MSMNARVMLGIAALGLSLPVVADQDFVPYVGADVKWNKMEFKNNSGGNTIQKNYPQGNLFAGLKFNEWVGLELGYESTARKDRTTTVPVGANFFGRLNSTAPVTSKTRTKISGFHFNVVGFYPIAESLSLFGSVGLAQLKLKTQLAFSFPGQQVDNRTFSKQKLVPRVTVGIQNMLTDNIGVRAMLAWEKTSSFKNIYAKNSTLFMTPKDSKSIGLGVFYNFK